MHFKIKYHFIQIECVKITAWRNFDAVVQGRNPLYVGVFPLRCSLTAIACQATVSVEG